MLFSNDSNLMDVSHVSNDGGTGGGGGGGGKVSNNNNNNNKSYTIIRQKLRIQQQQQQQRNNSQKFSSRKSTQLRGKKSAQILSLISCDVRNQRQRQHEQQRQRLLPPQLLPQQQQQLSQRPSISSSSGGNGGIPTFRGSSSSSSSSNMFLPGRRPTPGKVGTSSTSNVTTTATPITASPTASTLITNFWRQLSSDAVLAQLGINDAIEHICQTYSNHLVLAEQFLLNDIQQCSQHKSTAKASHYIELGAKAVRTLDSLKAYAGGGGGHSSGNVPITINDDQAEQNLVPFQVKLVNSALKCFTLAIKYAPTPSLKTSKKGTSSARTLPLPLLFRAYQSRALVYYRHTNPQMVINFEHDANAAMRIRFDAQLCHLLIRTYLRLIQHVMEHPDEVNNNKRPRRKQSYRNNDNDHNDDQTVDGKEFDHNNNNNDEEASSLCLSEAYKTARFYHNKAEDQIYLLAYHQTTSQTSMSNRLQSAKKSDQLIQQVMRYYAQLTKLDEKYQLSTRKNFFDRCGGGGVDQQESNDENDDELNDSSSDTETVSNPNDNGSIAERQQQPDCEHVEREITSLFDTVELVMAKPNKLYTSIGTIGNYDHHHHYDHSNNNNNNDDDYHPMLRLLRPLRKNMKVFSERPLAFAPYVGEYCQFCFVKISTRFTPCTRCSEAIFCTPQCARLAQRIGATVNGPHRALCRYQTRVMAHLSWRASLTYQLLSFVPTEQLIECEAKYADNYRQYFCDLLRMSQAEANNSNDLCIWWPLLGILAMIIARQDQYRPLKMGDNVTKRTMEQSRTVAAASAAKAAAANKNNTSRIDNYTVLIQSIHLAIIVELKFKQQQQQQQKQQQSTTSSSPPTSSSMNFNSTEFKQLVKFCFKLNYFLNWDPVANSGLYALGTVGIGGRSPSLQEQQQQSSSTNQMMPPLPPPSTTSEQSQQPTEPPPLPKPIGRAVGAFASLLPYACSGSVRRRFNPHTGMIDYIANHNLHAGEMLTIALPDFSAPRTMGHGERARLWWQWYRLSLARCTCKRCMAAKKREWWFQARQQQMGLVPQPPSSQQFGQPPALPRRQQQQRQQNPATVNSGAGDQLIQRSSSSSSASLPTNDGESIVVTHLQEEEEEEQQQETQPPPLPSLPPTTTTQSMTTANVDEDDDENDNDKNVDAEESAGDDRTKINKSMSTITKKRYRQHIANPSLPPLSILAQPAPPPLPPAFTITEL